MNYEAIDEIIDDQKKNTDTKINEEDDTIEFKTPKKFNLADKISIKVEDQGDYGLCWDFASTKSLETYLALQKNKKYDFSEMHVNYVTSNLLLGGREIDDGGNFEIYENYLADSGVVLEEKVGYQDYSEEEYSQFLTMKPVVTVTKTVTFPDPKMQEEKAKALEIRSAIRNHIMNYGSLYAQISTQCYDEATNTLYTDPEEFVWVDHAVSIVGWDDNYSKDNFPANNRPQKNGAYIALNSWGEEFGEKGYFYISYEDALVESGLSGVVSTSMKDAYEFDTIKNPTIKEVIQSKIANTFKKEKGKTYVTSLALARIDDLDLSNKGIDSLQNIDILKNLMVLNLSNNNLKASELKKLSELPQLSSLNLSNNTELKDVSNLKDTNLINLDISQNEDMKGYEKITNLEGLNISDCHIESVKSIAKLENLRELIVSNNNVKDISSLKSLPDLAILTAENCNIKNISEITQLHQLSDLDITNNGITSIESIGDLDNLYHLNVSQNPIKDFAPIANINHQEEGEKFANLTLFAESCDIKDISQFNRLTNVAELDLAYNEISDVSPFYNNTVYLLDLSGNKNLKNLQYLNNLESLYCLYLEECGIQELDEITKIQQLEVLDLAKNEITNVTALNKLSNLYALSLDENQNLSGNLKLKELSCLNIANTDYDSNNFDFHRCSAISELNVSGCKNIEKMKETIEDLDALYCIILENVVVNEDMIRTVNDKEIGMIGGMYSVTAEDETEIYTLDEKSPVRKVVMNSISLGGVDIARGMIDQSIGKIERTVKDSNNVVIHIAYSYKYQDFTIEIQYPKAKVEETPEQNNKKETTNENKIEKNENTTIDKNYTMVED